MHGSTPAPRRLPNLRTPRAVGALASPHRLELIAAMGDAGDTSIAELARRLGRSPHSLYYHVKRLVDAGLVVPVGPGRRGRRDAQFWRLAASRLVVDELSGLRDSPVELSKAVGAMLRLTTHELQRALREQSPGRVPERTMIGLRIKGRLDGATLARVHSLMQQIESVVRRANRSDVEGDVYSITLVPGVGIDLAGRSAARRDRRPGRAHWVRGLRAGGGARSAAWFTRHRRISRSSAPDVIGFVRKPFIPAAVHAA